MLARTWRNWNPCALPARMRTGAATVERVWWFLQKLELDLAYMIQQLHFGVYTPND